MKKEIPYKNYIILVLGLVWFPFLDSFIKNVNSVPQVYYFYLLFLLNTVVSYFWTYKRSLLIADQKQYVVNIYQAITQVLVSVLQIIFLSDLLHMRTHLLMQSFLLRIYLLWKFQYSRFSGSED